MLTQWEAVQTKRHLRGHTLASAKDFCFDYRQYTQLPVVSNDGTYSFMEFTSTKFSTTLKNINKIWLYCFVNRADTPYRYWGYSTFQKHPNLLCLCTTRAIIHKYKCRSPLAVTLIIFWPLGYRQHVHQKDPTEYTLWQHLGFCTVKINLSIKENQEKRRERKTKWAVKHHTWSQHQHLIISNETNRKSRLYMIQINTDCCPCLSVTPIEAPEKSLAQCHQRTFQPVQ